MSKIYKVYISSTYLDLKEEREAAAKVVRTLGLLAVAMEDYTSTEQKPVDKCLADVRSCDFYIGIFAYRYGYVPKNYEKSITHLEYEEAGKAGIPRLIFIVSDEAPWPRFKDDKDTSKIDALRKMLLEKHTAPPLSDISQLQFKITAALNNAIRELEKKQSSSAPAAGLGKNQFGIKIPSILPYLSNRSAQREELEEVLFDCLDCLHHKPLVCFIHGDEFECHDKFIEKIKSILLPDLLNLPKNKDSIGSLRINWPRPSITANKRFKMIEIELARNLTNKCEISVENVVTAINRRLTPLIIYATIQTACWQKKEPDLIKKWLAYWNNLPDLAIGKKLFLCLCVKYKNTEDMSVAQKKKFDALNKQAQSFIDGLQFSTYKNIYGLKFTELCAVEYEQLDDWIANFACTYCEDEDLRDEIDKYYKEQDMRNIPMSELAKKLKQICKEHPKEPQF